ncbi:hypothetical protein CfE428DRAFT_0584 [Chthoniobacter flavus Ellin428]|uniref:Uncharacterized protein n=1 Tax=Chthoniobacter flavus Ellin428 TaxID=497964 RepID=B4CV71_9BACT|nr:hypothetical protein CfE428DRAFT_0584 [Chthoniobacter flavus Ellin428]TCO82117.1 hypothetical protein EV701_1502 [Chthoniobacter flavus]
MTEGEDNGTEDFAGTGELGEAAILEVDGWETATPGEGTLLCFPVSSKNSTDPANTNARNVSNLISAKSFPFNGLAEGCSTLKKNPTPRFFLPPAMSGRKNSAGFSFL